MNSKDKKILDLAVSQFEFQLERERQTKLNQLHSSFTAPMFTTAPPGAPDSKTLNDILDNHDKAPGSTPIVSVPSTPSSQEYAMLSQIQLLESYIAILTAYCIYNEHPEPYDITDSVQAAAFIEAEAKWKNYVLTGGVVKKLAGYLPLGDAVAYSMDKNVTNVTLHAELLTALFGAFGFTAEVMTELDGILTNVAQTLKSLNLKFEKIDQTLDHIISYYYFDKVPGTGGDGEPPAMYEVKYRLFFLKINQKSWSVSVMKSSVSHFSFKANYFDSKATMSSTLVASDQTLIKESISKLTGKDSSAIEKLVNVRAIKSDPSA